MAEGDGLSKETLESLKKLAKSAESASAAQNRQAGIIDKSADAFTNLINLPIAAFAKAMGNNTQTFEELSNVGSSFGNSLNAMKIAAAESRLSLDEFADILKANSKNFSGLGGNVVEGGKAFARFSKEMGDSGVTENLRQMGYTSKDLNEVLALQLATSRSSAEDTEAGRKRTIIAAAELAEQMDSLAKLTGKSRKEQMEAYKAQQADMQLEAALRRDTAGMSKEQAEEYKKKVRDSIEYERTMRGDAAAAAAKEYYATGTLMSDTARKYVAVSGEAGQASMQQMEAIKKRDYEAAEAHKKRADKEAIAMQDNPAYQNLIIYQTKAAGVVGETMKATQAVYDSTKNISDKMGLVGTASEKVGQALDIAKQKIKEEQQAREGHTSLMIASQRRLEDVNAASTRAVREQLTAGGKLDKDLKDTAKNLSQQSDPTRRPKEIVDTYSAAQEKAAKDPSLMKASQREQDLDRMKPAIKPFVEAAGALAGKMTILADKGLDVGGKGLDRFNENFEKFSSVIEKLTGKLGELIGPKKEGRAGGTIGETGQLLEPKDVMALLHKGEMVLTPEQQKNLINNSRNNAFSDMLTIISQKSGDASKLPGIDLQKVAKDIATTTSKVEVTNWPKSMPVQVSGAQSAKPADAKSADPKPAEAKIAPKEDKTKATQASVRAVDNEIDKKKGFDKKTGAGEFGTDAKVKESSTTTTKLTVNGRDVDPNSKEGQAAMKQLDESTKKTEEAIKQLTVSMGAGGNTVTLDTKSIEEMAKSSGIHMTEAQKQVAATSPTAKSSGPSMTKKSSAEFLLDNQITQASSDMRGSSAVDKSALNDALSLSEKEREEKKKKYQEEYDLAQKEVSDRDKRLIEIEKRYEDEGRAADAKNDEEYKRLEAEEKIFLEQRGNAQKNLQALKEVDDIKRKVEDQGYDFEKVNAARLQNLTKESAEAVQKEMKEAIPVKELQGSLTKASESLDDHGKKTLQLVMNDSDEMLETRKRNAKNIIKSEEADIAERQSKIKELENKAAESELSSREKKWLDEEKAEIAKAEERKKFQESDLRAIELVEKSRQGILEESNKATIQAYDSMADEVEELSKVLPDTVAKASDEIEVIADDMRAGITDIIPTSEVQKSLADMMMEADEAFSNVPDYAQQAKDNLMAEANELFDIMPDQAQIAKDNLMIEANEMFDIMPDHAQEARDNMMLEANAMAEDFQSSMPNMNFQPVEYDEFAGVDKAAAEQKEHNDQAAANKAALGDWNDQATGGTGEGELSPKLEEAKKSAIAAGFKMPKLGEIRTDSRGAPTITRQDTKTMADKNTGAEAKKEADKAKDTKESGTTSKEAEKTKTEPKSSQKTLDDVVKVLELLNTNIGKLTNKVEESINKQITAMKSSMSGNLFNK